VLPQSRFCQAVVYFDTTVKYPDWGTSSAQVNARVKVKVKQSHYRPRGFQEVKVPRFCDDTGWW